MTMTQEEQKALEDLKTALEKLCAVSTDSLIRTGRLGSDLDFKNGVDVFDRTLNLFQRLKQTELNNVPASVIAQLKSQTDAAFEIFEQIRKFDVSKQQNPANQRDTLISNVQSQYAHHFRELSPVIAFCSKQGSDLEKISSDGRIALSQMRSLLEESEQKSKAILLELSSVLEKVRRAAAEVGVAQHSIHFKEEADVQESSSVKWLRAFAGVSVLTIVYGVYCLVWLTKGIDDFSSAQSIQMFIAKVMLFSVLYYGIVWTGRMYRAVRHNNIVNRHRQNALSTFETFVKAAGDDTQTKSAVLLQATQSIFSPQPSGFALQEGDSSSPTQILEIVRGLPKQ